MTNVSCTASICMNAREPEKPKSLSRTLASAIWWPSRSGRVTLGPGSSELVTNYRLGATPFDRSTNRYQSSISGRLDAMVYRVFKQGLQG
jgi:hypothetical protein